MDFLFQFQQCKSFDDLLALYKKGLIGCTTICKVERRKLWFFKYHHYFMIYKVTNECVQIIHLSKSRWFKLRGKIETINFSAKLISQFDFITGVFVSCENFPLKETIVTERKNRLFYMINKYYAYSLTSTSPDKHNCESFVYQIKKGAKQNNEVCEFKNKYGKIGKLIIRIVDLICSCS